MIPLPNAIENQMKTGYHVRLENSVMKRGRARGDESFVRRGVVKLLDLVGEAMTVNAFHEWSWNIFIFM